MLALRASQAVDVNESTSLVHGRVTLLGYAGSRIPVAASRRAEPERPLVVFSGQGVSRADGFNLTRRAKALPAFAEHVRRLERCDRQNLDAVLHAAVGAEVPPVDWIQAFRTLCMKELRRTFSKTTHRELFELVAGAAQSRLVVHLTSNVDGISTTILVRDHGALWAPFRGVSSMARVRSDFVKAARAGRGLAHFPLHGEIGLYVSEPEGERLRTAYHHPEPGDDGTTWISSLLLGPGRGLQNLESGLRPGGFAVSILEALLRGGPLDVEGVSCGDFAPADLLVVGYGATDRGAHADNPFERVLDSLSDEWSRQAGSRHALLYNSATPRHVASWFERHGFTLVSYGDDELVAKALPLLSSGAATGRNSSPRDVSSRVSVAVNETSHFVNRPQTRDG